MSRKGHPNELGYVFIDDTSQNPSAPAVVGDLVQVAMYFWDTNALAWVKATGGSATGADVNVTNFPAVYPATVANGADVAQGSTTDVSGTPTTIGLLKQIASAGPSGSGAGSVNVLNQVHVIIDGQPISVTGAAGGSSGGSVVVLNQVSTIISGTPTVLQGGAPWQVAGSVAATQGGVWNVGISGTPTVLQGNAPWQVAGSVAATQGGVWNVGITGTPTVLQGTPPWQVAGSIAVTQGTTPWLVTGAPSPTPSSTFVAGSFGSVNVLNTVNVLVTGQPISVTSAPSGTPTSTFVAGTVTAVLGAGTNILGSMNVAGTVNAIISGVPTVDVRSVGLSSVSVVGTVNTVIGAGSASMGSVNIGGGVVQVISGGNTLGSVNVGGGVIGLLTSTNTIGSTNISSGQINVIGGPVPTGGFFPANPLPDGGRAIVGNPTAVDDLDAVPFSLDKQGRTIGYPFTPRMHMAQGGSTTSGTGETTFIPAGSTNVFHDMALLVLSNLGSLSTPTVFIRDRTAGPVIFRMALGAFQVVEIPLSRPWEQQVAASPWTMQLDRAGGSVFVTGQVVKLI